MQRVLRRSGRKAHPHQLVKLDLVGGPRRGLPSPINLHSGGSSNKNIDEQQQQQQ